MDKQPEDLELEQFLDTDSEQEKEEIISQMAKGADVLEADPTRSSLHYGNEAEGETWQEDANGRPTNQGASPGSNAAEPPTEDGAGTAIGVGGGAGEGTEGQSNFVENTEDQDTGTGAVGSSHTSDFQSASFASIDAPVDGAAPEAPIPTNAGFDQVEPAAAPLPDAPDVVNAAPTEVLLSNSSISENDAGGIIGRLDVADANGGDSHVFEVSDDRFDVVDGNLVLKPGVSLNHEDAASLSIEITATDKSGASVTQAMTVEVLDVNEGPTGLSLSNGAVAQTEAGAVVGELSVTDPDAGDVHSFSVSDDRFDVVDGHLVLKPGVSLSEEEASSLDVEVTATDAAGASFAQSFSVEVLDVPEVSASSGFHAQYFDVNHSLRKLDDVDWNADPTHQEVTGDINYKNSGNSFWEGGSRDTFGVQVNGNVVVEEGGSFKFSLGGDDGAMLFVNGHPVIDNDGLHGFRTRTGEVDLEPGTHHIEVRYFENYGHAGLKLEWEGPGVDGKELVTAPESDVAQTVEGVALTVDVSLSDTATAESAAVAIEGLPEGTVVQAGSQSATAGEDGTVDVSGWETDVLQITPPLGFTGEVDAQITATVSTESGHTASSSQSLPFSVEEAVVEAPTADLVGGFHASYFDVNHSLRRIDDIDWESTPTHEEMVSDIDYANSRNSFWDGGSQDTFGAKLEGEVTIQEGGSYKFFAGGDDGVVLFVNGVEVIDNDGLHGFRTRSGEIELEPGTYDIELRYFENYGHAGLKLEWEGPDTDGRELVRADSDTSIEENGTLEVGVSMDGASDQAIIEISGLPADTIIISGEMSAVVGDDPLDISDWNIELLEISPPPSFEGMMEGEITVSDVAFNGAEVSSSTPFSVAVGDVSAASDIDGAQADIVMADDQAAQSGADQSWDANETEEDDADVDDEVMAEAAVVQDVQSIADLDTETHDRPDW